MITLMAWIILAATVPAQGRNWMVCNTSCYRFAEHEEHWYSAMEYCTTRGWLPLKIDDQIEFNYVQHQLREHYDIYGLREYKLDGHTFKNVFEEMKLELIPFNEGKESLLFLGHGKIDYHSSY